MCKLWVMEKVSLPERVTAGEGNNRYWKECASSHQDKGNGNSEELQQKAIRGGRYMFINEIRCLRAV